MLFSVKHATGRAPASRCSPSIPAAERLESAAIRPENAILRVRHRQRRTEMMLSFEPPEPQEVRSLIEALGSEKESRVRWEAAAAPGRLGDARAGEPLLAALQDRDWDMPRAAAEALRQIEEAQR
jgi:HEAT repeat protein